jgi:hypothetical protein
MLAETPLPNSTLYWMLLVPVFPARTAESAMKRPCDFHHFGGQCDVSATAGRRSMPKPAIFACEAWSAANHSQASAPRLPRCSAINWRATHISTSRPGRRGSFTEA